MRDFLVAAAAAATAGAAAIHFSVLQEHFDESWTIGLFFAVAAWAQLIWPILAPRAKRKGVLVAGIAGNLAIASVWVMSRTVGLPVGSEPWTPEAVGLIDMLATIFETSAAAATIAAMRVQRGAVDPRRAVSALSLLALVIVPITTVAIATDSHHREPSHENKEHR